MWGLIIQAGILVGIYVYHRWIEDHPKLPLSAVPVVPSVAPGTAMPILYGTCRIRTPILVWSGNYLVPGQSYTPIGGGPAATADHFSLDTFFMLGVPFYGGRATILGMTAGDTPFNTGAGIDTTGVGAGTAHTQQFEFGNRPPATSDLSVNGVFYRGSNIQDANNGTPSTVIVGATTFDDGVSYGLTTSYHAALTQAGHDLTLVPGYRNQCGVFMHLGIGLTPTIPSFGFEVVALSTGLASDMGHSLADDADPAAVIYDLLTSPWGKLALPSSKIDLTSFQAASLTLFNESHGYSRCISQSEDAMAIISDVLRQIDGMLYAEPTTGKLVLKLIRNDYNPAALVDLNPSNVQAPPPGWYSIPGFSETMNQVRLTFTDRINGYSDGLALGQNTSNIVGQGIKLRAVDIHFQGCCNAALAQKLASRELAVVSKPMAKATVVANRNLYTVRPGDPVTLTWPELGINKMIMRVASADFGQLHQNAITFNLIRDVFDVQLGAYAVL